MGKKLRTLLLSVLCTFALALVPALVACSPSENDGPGGQDTEPKQYTVTVDETEHSTVTVDKTTAKPTEKITVTATSDYGYVVSAIKMNGTALTLSNGTATFDMPEANATVKAELGVATNAKVGTPVGGGY